MHRSTVLAKLEALDPDLAWNVNKLLEDQDVTIDALREDRKISEKKIFDLEDDVLALEDELREKDWEIEDLQSRLDGDDE